MTIPIERLDDYRWQIPAGTRPGMKVPAIVFADDRLMEQIRDDLSLEQAANAATLPGVVRAAYTHARHPPGLWPAHRGGRGDPDGWGRRHAGRRGIRHQLWCATAADRSDQGRGATARQGAGESPLRRGADGRRLPRESAPDEREPDAAARGRGALGREPRDGRAGRPDVRRKREGASPGQTPMP